MKRTTMKKVVGLGAIVFAGMLLADRSHIKKIKVSTDGNYNEINVRTSRKRIYYRIGNGVIKSVKVKNGVATIEIPHASTNRTVQLSAHRDLDDSKQVIIPATNAF